jgi:hypothetical protein
MLSFLRAVVKRENQLTVKQKESCQNIEVFFRTEFEGHLSPRSSHKVMLNNRKPGIFNSRFVKHPDIYLSALLPASSEGSLYVGPVAGLWAHGQGTELACLLSGLPFGFHPLGG